VGDVFELLEELESLSSLELDSDESDSVSLLTLDFRFFLFCFSITSEAVKGITVLGMAFKWSLRSSVSPPKPIYVKKLMANLVFRGSSRGNRPSKAS